MRYIFTNFFTGFVFFIIFFSFLFRHFTIVDEPPLNLNCYNYGTITRIFSRTDYIDFYEKCFFKYETLRVDLENSHITLHSNEDLNIRSMEGSYTLCTDFHWIQVAMMGLLITKSFFKDPVNVVAYIFYMQLCFSLSTLFFSESEFTYHSSLRLCTTIVLFSTESIKIINKVSNQTQYLYLQLDSLNKVRCLKNHSLYLKLILLLSGDISLNPEPNQTNHQLTEDSKVFKNRGLHFIHLNINSLLSEIDELRELVKASNATVVGITESKLDD